MKDLIIEILIAMFTPTEEEERKSSSTKYSGLEQNIAFYDM